MIRAALAALCALGLSGAPAHAASVSETELVPSRIAVGDTAALRITVNDVDDAEPVSAPRVAGLDISFNGAQHFSNVQIINMQMKKSAGVVLTFAVSPQRPGTFVIPSVAIRAGSRRLSSRAVTLYASAGQARPRDNSRPSSRAVRLYGSIECSKRAVFVGEPVVLRYFILHSGVEFEQNPMPEKMPETKGFVQKAVEERIEAGAENRDGAELAKTHFATYVLIPTQSGEFTIGGGSAIVVAGSRDEFFGFSFPRQRRVLFREERVSVRALPEAGKPDDFQGNVGSFTIEASSPPGRTPVFEELKLTVKVRGRGNLISLVRPAAIEAGDTIRVIGSDGKETLRIEQGALAGEKEFTFSLIPERPGPFDLGGFTLNFFNPESMRYESVASGRIAFEATGDASRQAGTAIETAKKADGAIDLNYLAIALALLGVAAIVAAVVLWERRRFREIAARDNRTEQPKRVAPAVGRGGIDRTLHDLSGASRRRDAPVFLKTAEIAINELERLAREGALDAVRAANIRSVKERLFSSKYGGGGLADAEMDELYRSIAEIADGIRPS